MDSNFNIYNSLNVSPEDKARLEGFLKGREEADMKVELERMREALTQIASRTYDTQHNGAPGPVVRFASRIHSIARAAFESPRPTDEEDPSGS